MSPVPGTPAFSRRAAALEAGAAAAAFLALTLITFGRVLFGPADRILSNEDSDLPLQFVHWRAFGFHELRAGHLALWNPHIYGGTPFFGGFQSALLYPPNWLYLVLPLGGAINWGIALHVFLAGMFMYAWMRRRGLHPVAGWTAGVLFMYCGPYFGHIFAGHLPNLCAIIWAPLVFLGIDGWLEDRRPGWLWLGAGATALQILAGHPQYVFYTGVAAGLYCVLRLPAAPRRVQAIVGLAAMVAAAVGLSAVQLFEGLHAAGQMVRSTGISRYYARSFSFPPENFLTLLAPQFFGNMKDQPYWGRCSLWEMSAFMSVTGLVLAAYGAARGERTARRFCAVMAGILFLLALGRYTPLFTLLYRYVPGFDKFRGMSKFTSVAILFPIALAACGLDALLRRGAPGRRMCAGVAAAGICVAGIAWWLGSPWAARLTARGVNLLLASHEAFQSHGMAGDPVFVRGAVVFASRQLLAAAGVLLAVAAVFAAARFRRRALYALPAIATLEMLVFAHRSLDTCALSAALNSPAAEFLEGQPRGPYRIFNQGDPNLGMSIGQDDIWGYDPGVLRRYAEWMAFSQKCDPDEANQMLSFWRFPRLYPLLLRCRYVIAPEPAPDSPDPDAAIVRFEEPAAPRLRLVPEARVIRGRDQTFAAMEDKDFDPARTVYLQTPPDPAPVPGPGEGSVRLVGSTSDRLTIEADLPRAAILLITDTYCTGWRARSLLPPEGAAQRRYEIVPADYFLRAIALRAGHHRILMEYRPAAFLIGAWISGLTLAGYALGGIRLLRPPAR